MKLLFSAVILGMLVGTSLAMIKNHYTLKPNVMYNMRIESDYLDFTH